MRVRVRVRVRSRVRVWVRVRVRSRVRVTLTVFHGGFSSPSMSTVPSLATSFDHTTRNSGSSSCGK